MKLFFDTEFTGLHQKTTLISLGVVSEDGKTFYAEFTDYDKTQLNDWLVTNVINNLLYKDFGDSGIIIANNPSGFRIRANTRSISEQLSLWLRQFDSVEMWSDCLAYDWVLFNNIFGDAFQIPKNVYYIPFDICTLFKTKNIDPDINREEFAEISLTDNPDIHLGLTKHNALWDAHIIKKCYDKLTP